MDEQRAGTGPRMMLTLLALTVWFAIGRRKPLQSREKLAFWYDGKREGKPIDLG